MRTKLALLSSIVCSGLLAQTIGINLQNMDTTVNPTKDFYSYCNGNWQKTFKLSASDSRYGSFNEIHENNLKKFRIIYGELAKDKTVKPGTNTKKLQDFYTVAIDSVKADKLGAAPVKPQLAMIDKIKTTAELLNLKTDLDKIGVSILFSGSVSPDLKNARRHIFGIGQNGFGISDRDYYFDAKFDAIRSAYMVYLEKGFTLIGYTPEKAKEAAQHTYDIEKTLAKEALNRTRLRDYEKMYNIYTKSQLQALTPNFNWTSYFLRKGVKQPDTVIVGQPEYMKALDACIKQFSVEQWKNYAKSQLIQTAADYLGNDFVQAKFAYVGTALRGATQMKARWELVHNECDAYLGHAFSELYVKKYFPPQSKAKMDVMINNLIASFRERLSTRTWMSDNTKKEAYRKLDLLLKKIGYPQKWDDYSSMAITQGSYWSNIVAASMYYHKKSMSKLYKATDRNEWQITPATVNAYYDPTTDEITFPAAILQPPFFDAEADDAFNYGIMGSIIGHELTHGFDDGGSQFDADGNLKMWWTDNDYKNFKERKEKIVQQFNNIVMIDTMRVNGEMTQGENIADLGGLTMAYYAYKKSLNGKASVKVKGFTGEQRFFIAWAQGWKNMSTDQETKRLLVIDYHSPAKLRAYVPLTNMPEFFEAFQVKEGDAMREKEAKRVEIW